MAMRRYAKEVRGRAPQFWVIAEGRERFDVAIGDAETALVKKAALAAHASQIAVFKETYSIVSGKEIRYDRAERLRKSSIRPFQWIKPVALALWALPLGVLLTIVGTMLHTITADDSASTPIGLYVALGITALLALGLRLLRESRGALYLMTLTLVGSLFWLSDEKNPTGFSVAENELGTWWFYGSIAISAFVMLFPRLSSRSLKRGTSGHR